MSDQNHLDLFDFHAFLKKYDPGVSYKLTKCSGGKINLTVRAARIPAASSETVLTKTTADSRSFSSDSPSFILKFAPPFIAVLGSGFPFTQARQDIEAAALSLVHSKLSDSFSSVGPESCISTSESVRVPALLHFFKDDHVLVIEDLGELLNIQEWLLSDLSPSTALCQAVGERLGKWIGQLHSGIKQTDIPHGSPLNSEIGDDLVKMAIVDTIPEYLDGFGLSGGIEAHIILAESHTRSHHLDKVFSVGDLWPPSVLISNRGNQMAVIDWEFAGFAAPMQDLAQLAAHLHLLLLSSIGPELRDGIRTLLRSMFLAYQHTCAMRGVTWLDPTSSTYLDCIRAAWLLHGRELINNAAEEEWPGCVPIAAGREAWTKCELRRHMARRGLYYVQVGGVDRNAFKTRWNEVLEEDVLGALYLPLDRS